MLIQNRPTRSVRVGRLLGRSAIATCAFFASNVFAQSTQTAASGAAINEDLSEVVVTGTSIRGVAPTGSELVTVSEHQIEATSAASVNDIFHQIPALSGLNGTPPIRSDPMNSINLPSIHGLPGTGLVLVLFDGYRGVGAGILSNSPDPSSIPASALERVEVVPDGASAIYGSDAVTGVVNLVLRKNFDGLEVNARYGFASQYDHSDASFVWGHSWEGGNVMVAYQYEGNSELYGSQRSQFYHLNQTNDQEANGTPGFDWRDTGCDPGTVYVTNPNTITMANPSGTPTAYPLSSTRQLGAAGPANKCDNSGYNSLIPREWRNNAVVNAHQELTDTLELWGQAFVAFHDAEKDVVQGEATNFTIPNTNPYFQVPAAYTGPAVTSIGFDYGLENIVGVPLRDDLNFKTYTGRGGLTWKIGSTWEGKVVGNFGHESDFFINRFTNFANYQNALDGTTLNTAFNPFGPNTSYVVNSLQDYLYNAYMVVQNLGEGLVSFDGSLFHIAGGDVKLSVGGSYRRETYDGLATSGTRDTGAPTLADHAINARTDASEYAELYVPVFGASNALPGLQRLEFSFAGRHDQYNDFGGTTNPKIGFNWSPGGGLQIHGNYSTSFHAPNLADDTVPSIDSHAQAFCCIFPPPGSPPGTPGLYTIILNGGSSNISPEKSKNYSVGFDETLPELTGLKFGLNYFHSAFSNQIGFLPPPFLYSGGAAAKFYTVYPTLKQELAFIAGYPLQVSSINGGALPGLLLDLRRQNIGAVNFGGFDFNASYTRRLFSGQFTVNVGGTSLTLYEAQGVQGSGSFLNELGTGTDPKWQGRGSIEWTNELIDTAIYVNYTGAYLYYANTTYHPVRDYKPVSWHFGVTPFSGRLKKVQFTLDVDNVFNEDPPYVDEGVQGDNAANGFDKQEANPIGRLITVGLRAAL
jgi:iron complex outermembrane receptor protein